MTLTERLQNVEAEQHMPANVVPMRQPKERRTTPRWLEWTREHQQERTAHQDLTGYLKDVA